MAAPNVPAARNTAETTPARITLSRATVRGTCAERADAEGVLT